MKNWFKSRFCKHELETKSYMATDTIVGEWEIKCKKCGRIKEEWLYGYYRIIDWVHIDDSDLFTRIFKKKALKFLREEQWKQECEDNEEKN